ncbi:hypothetical protein RM532_08815 [Salinisphaera sp. W335]|uniref:Uncharacterized protein n=1 Tax=Spectribacter hydrogenoxidans TaxID=3075608 RepID=A0ABU3C0Z9_9GAMM|nr:hypothetical protein [Salinisphaera sp. W335]MDT0635059.1 hypothetical protein [Salinisphaera sp. W335]
MGVVLDAPLVAGLAAVAAFVAAIREAFAHDVPGGGAGVGKGVPFDADQGAGGALEAGGVDGFAPAGTLGAFAQVEADAFQVGGGAQAGLGDFAAFAHGAGADVFELVAHGGAAAGAPAGADVFGHAGQALHLAHEAVDFVHGRQRAVDDDLGDAVGVGQREIAHVDAAALHFMAKGVGEFGAAADAGGVGGQQDGPAAILVADALQQALEGGAVFVLGRFDGVGEFFNDLQILAPGVLVEFAPL